MGAIHKRCLREREGNYYGNSLQSGEVAKIENFSRDIIYGQPPKNF
jgi:hypothetical protein